MRRIVLLVVVMALFGSGRANASVFYTFDGTINEVFDAGGIAAAAGFSIGSAVSYTFAVDFNADGYRLFDDGSKSFLTDDALNDYFYADFISGTLLQESAVFFDSPFANIVEQNFGRTKTIDGNVVLGQIDGNSHLESTLVSSSNLGVSDWVIGTSVQGYDQTYNADGEKSFVRSTLSVTSIPEPSALTLATFALLGLACGRRRRPSEKT